MRQETGQTPQEQAARLRQTVGERIVAGRLVDETSNFVFEVWAYRRLTEKELARAYAAWQRQRNKDQALHNQTIRVLSNLGSELL